MVAGGGSLGGVERALEIETDPVSTLHERDAVASAGTDAAHAEGPRRETVRVSVIMPFLDQERYIAEAIESVLDQGYTAWELLLVDDGSTDGSTAIAREHATRYPNKIRYFEHPGHANRGASASRNLGIRHARGEFLALLDADDLWLPHKLEQQVPLLDAHPEIGMLYGHTLRWYSWLPEPAPGPVDHYPNLGVPLNRLLQPPELAVRCVRGKAAIPCTCSVLLRREVVERVGGFEESFLRVFTDQAFYLKLFAVTPVLVVNRTWDRYRIHGASAVSLIEAAGRFRTERTNYLRWAARYVAEREVGGRRLNEALRTELWFCTHPRTHQALTWTRRSLRRARQGLRRRVEAGASRIAARLRRGGTLSSDRASRRTAPDGKVDTAHSAVVQAFFARHAHDVRGRVLDLGCGPMGAHDEAREVAVGDPALWHSANPQSVLANAAWSEAAAGASGFDCVLLCDVLHLVGDVPAVLRRVRELLKPGGVVLATMAGADPLFRPQREPVWFSAFTAESVRRLFEACFPAEAVQVEMVEAQPDTSEATSERARPIVTVRARRVARTTNLETESA
jgi:glycosyltransferase involved in cell wall biosynthesis/SAM-dependent methyltransferase